MRSMKLHITGLLVAMFTFTLGACSAYNTEPKSIVLPSSNKSIDLVQHRSDVRLTDCGTLIVLQTYSNEGKLIDSKEARGSALHCVLLPALIEAGGRVGAGAVQGAASTVIRNVNQQAQGQLQGQQQQQTNTSGAYVENTNVNTNANSNANNANGGAGGNGGTGGEGGNGGAGGGNGQGNNGGGNGDGDGTNPGTDNHHDNGDNS